MRELEQDISVAFLLRYPHPFLLAPQYSPLSSSSAPHSYSCSYTKGVIGLEKAELTGILNDDTL